MAIKAIRFNLSKLRSLSKARNPITVKDTDVIGLKFKVGRKRSVFQFEKRIAQMSGIASAPVTFTLGPFPTISIDEARQQARQIANLCERGIDPRVKEQKNVEAEKKAAVTLRQAIAQFFEAKQELSKSTLKTYAEVIKYNFNKKWMRMDIRDITPEMIAAQFHKSRKTQRDRCWKFLKVYGNIWNTCAPFFKDDSGKRLLGQNPIPEVRSMLKNIKRDQPKRSVIPANLLGKYVVTLEKLRAGELYITQPGKKPPKLLVQTCDLLLLCLFTAFRFIEAQNLRWEYIDLDQGLIRLPGTTRVKSGHFQGTKNHRDHYVPLSTYAWNLISAHPETMVFRPGNGV